MNQTVIIKDTIDVIDAISVAIERQIGGRRLVIQTQAEQTGIFDRHSQFVGGLLQNQGV
mgnify:CR=1 FL=1